MAEVIEERKNRGWWPQAGTIPRLAVFLFIFAASWFILKELAALLRPLLAASLICFIILPIHKRLHQRHSRTAATFILAGGALLILGLLSLLIYGSIVEFNDELPRLTKRSLEFSAATRQWSHENLPDWLSRSVDDALRIESMGAAQVSAIGKSILQHAADIFLELLVVVLYVFFLLLETRRLKQRVEAGFKSSDANLVKQTFEAISTGISGYIRAKVISSLILAAPVAVALLLFGVKSAALWAMLTFLCNFIPYVGVVAAGGGAILFAFLDLPLGWQPFAVATFIIVWHTVESSLIEPSLLGNAVGLSPLVILVCLTFWGICWGILGMLLAVPLTVALKIVLSNIEATQPIAKLLGDDSNPSNVVNGEAHFILADRHRDAPVELIQ
jgi:AI-2 transport protein TqsA